MKVLTEIQKVFLLEYFFKNERYAGWKNIASKLLENGSCIVAGDKCIWMGGVGNFIKTENAENAIDCLLYKFDLENFVTSEFYKERRNIHVEALVQKKKEVEQELDEICQIGK